MNNMLQKMSESIHRNFRFSTLSFIFIIAYVNIFQMIFGAENSIVGVIFTILMSASMVRDLTATPLKHLVIQAAVLVWMAIAACLVNTLSAPLSFLVNFITLLLILYAYTYEYSSHIYFPYILSYLFLIFISPVGIERLPGRILGMLTGALSIMLYQWFMGRKRVVETARDVLSEMIDDINLFISYRLGENAEGPDLSDTRHKLCRLSQTVYDRRKKNLCVSDASFSMIDAGRGLEHLLILLHELPDKLSEREKKSLQNVTAELNQYRAFLQQEIPELPPIKPSLLFTADSERETELFDHALIYIHDRLEHMTDPERRIHYHKTALSFKVRIQAALGWSSVRAVYALRTALLLSCATALVQQLALPHGKWLLFTLASVSLPYSDDVPAKIKKRVTATVIGGLASVVIYALIPSPTARTAIMMLSGYLSFYFKDYAATFACSTIGALGGAVFMNGFGFQGAGSVFLIRFGYILAGVAAGYLINCLILPYSRARATEQLWKKYKTITELLTRISHSARPDPQLYYHLIIQAHLLEDKLTQNAFLEKWKELPGLLLQCREQVRQAHRTWIAERTDAPVFEPEHLAL